jgi:thiol-disulfide isomerase/thioredoxin
MNTNFRRNRIKQVTMLFMLICLTFIKINAQTVTEEKPHEHVCTEDKEMIIGRTNLDAIKQNHVFWSEYLHNYEQYVVDEPVVEEIIQLLQGRKISATVVLGTWCGDSKEQFPVFEKIIEKIPQNRLFVDIIGVDRDKLAADMDISSFGIEFVPTYIFYEEDKEIGRIVETPSITMEKDILEILRKK